MSARRKPKLPLCTAAVRGGMLICRLAASDGEPLALFCGDEALGESGFIAEAGGFTAQFSLDALPATPGPLEFRFMNTGTGEEIKPALTFRDTEALLVASGPGPIWCQLAACDGGAISFRAAPAHLPLIERRLELLVDGISLGTAMTVPPKPPEIGKRLANADHDVSFALPATLRDGALIELFDTATQALVHSETITWATIAAALTGAHKILEERQNRLTAELGRLRAKLGAVGDMGKDALLLERLDCYHALVMDRLDREFAAMRRELGLADSHFIDTGVAPAQLVLPAELEGVGLYHVEFDGDRQWRWFGPETTLIMRNINPAVRLLRINYLPPSAQPDLGHVHCQVNGREARTVQVPTEHAQVLELCLTPAMHRPDRSLIVHLTFENSYSPPNDERALTMSCSTIELIAA